jgi:hypothetical protein
MDSNDEPRNGPLGGLNIDFDHLDAAEINERIRLAAAAGSSPGDPPLPPPPPGTAPDAPPPPALKSRMKGRLRRLLAPFFPALRLLSLPVQEDLAEATRILHATNVRVDEMAPILSRSIEYLRIMHVLNHNLVLELTKLRIEHDALKNRVRLLEKDLDFLTRRERAVERQVFP